MNGLEKCEMLTRQEVKPTLLATPSWSEAKYRKNNTNNFLSVYEVMYDIVNSWNDQGKVLKEHILKDIVPCGFDTRIAEIQKEHQQQTTKFQLVITDRDNQIRTIHYENVALQVQRDVYQAQVQRYQKQIHDLIITRHVPRANDRHLKITSLWLLTKTPLSKKISFMSILTISRGIQTQFISSKRR